MPKIVRFEKFGAPDVLKIFDEPLQEPGPGDVRLKVEALGLNRAEVMLREGKYVTVPQFPARISILHSTGLSCHAAMRRCSSACLART